MGPFYVALDFSSYRGCHARDASTSRAVRPRCWRRLKKRRKVKSASACLVGGFVGRLIGWYGEGDPLGFIMAVVGSIILLAIYRFTFGRAVTV
jgi:Transglycosylase associated protein